MSDIKREFKVYCHITPNNKKYIGITKQNVFKRWLNGNGYRTNTLFYRAIQKYKWENIEHKILAKNLTSEEACRLEQWFIKYYNTITPNGYNITTGGEHFLHNPETIKKLKFQKIGNKNHRFNLPPSLNPNSKSVYCIETQEVFTSIKEAMQNKNMKSNHISDCCNNKRRTANGYHWMWYKDYLNCNEEYIQYILNMPYGVPESKKIFCINNQQVYNSINEASRILNIDRKLISACLNKKKKTTHGLKFIFI